MHVPVICVIRIMRVAGALYPGTHSLEYSTKMVKVCLLGWQSSLVVIFPLALGLWEKPTHFY